MEQYQLDKVVVATLPSVEATKLIRKLRWIGLVEEATRLQALAAELRLALKLSSFRSLVKDAMQAAGMPVGQPRRPAGSISAEEQAAIDAIVGKLRERNYLPEQIPAPRGAGW